MAGWDTPTVDPDERAEAGANPMVAPQEPILDANQIQGGAVPGFMKPHMAVLALRIEDVGGAKAWLADLAPTVTTLAQAMVSNVAVREYRGLGRERIERLGMIPQGMDDAWLSVSLSSGSMARLLAGGPYAEDVAAFTDAGFQAGMAARSSLLGDPQDPSAEGNPANWVVGSPGGDAVDVLMVVGADHPETGEGLLDQVREQARGSGLTVVYEEWGHKLDKIGKEHFGFQDGVSQPGVRGYHSEDPGSCVTPRTIDPTIVPDAWLYGLPGQDLVWPGEFVFGYPKSAADPLMAGRVNLPGPWWSRNGSYLVFRRLRQDVAGFWRWVNAYAESLEQRSSFRGVTPEWLAARIVGRWPSGAPVSRQPHGDDEWLGANRLANDDFGYAASAVAPPGSESSEWPPAEADPLGLVCPMSAHIRKVNARETPSDAGGRRASFERRLLRRGLPYGERLPPPFDEDPQKGDRGLLFLSYQASIEDQFEFVSRSWMNSPTNPRSPGGHDLLVGQNGTPGAKRARSAGVLAKDGTHATLTAPSDFVIPTGGGYFFSPSIDALREVLAR
jgi:Dyp-type peroxidase family